MQEELDGDRDLKRQYEADHPLQQKQVAFDRPNPTIQLSNIALQLSNVGFDPGEATFKGLVAGHRLGRLARLVLRRSGGKQRVIKLGDHRRHAAEPITNATAGLTCASSASEGRFAWPSIEWCRARNGKGRGGSCWPRRRNSPGCVTR